MSLQLKSNDTSIEVKSGTLLGVFFDKYLKWHVQIAKIGKIINSRLHLLK